MQQSKNPDYKRTNWSAKETRPYLRFLVEHEDLFFSYATKKKARVFMNISLRVKTRGPNQVKSHHQKLLNRHHTVKAIIVFLREQQEVYGQEEYSVEEPYELLEPLKTKPPRIKMIRKPKQPKKPRERKPRKPRERKPRKPKEPRKPREPRNPLKDMLKVRKRNRKPSMQEVKIETEIEAYRKFEVLPTSTELRPYPAPEQSESDDFVFSVVGSEDWPQSEMLDRLERIKRMERQDDSGASFWSSESFEI